MKRWVVSASTNRLTDAELVSILQESGIDTTMCKYELKAEDYGSGEIYTERFNCPGDYLAYMSMSCHCEPEARELNTSGIGVRTANDLYAFIEETPDLAAIRKRADYFWSGDGCDYIIHLYNLTTGETLYEQSEPEVIYRDLAD